MEILRISIDFVNALLRDLEKVVLKSVLNYVVDRLCVLGVYTALPDICAGGLHDYCYLFEEFPPPYEDEGYG